MINNVQLLRALAALMVVLGHCSGLNVSFALLPDGLGVDLFFLINGFVMVFTTSANRVRPWEFLVNRVIRIVPLYWALTLGVFALSAVAPALVKATRPDVGELIMSLFFIAFTKSNGLVFPTLFPGWSLNYEMFFYVLFAVSLVNRSAIARVVAVTAVLAGLVAAGSLVGSGHPVLAFYTSGKLLEFAYGMVLGLVYPRIALRPPSAAIGVAIITVGLVALSVLSVVAPGLPIPLNPGIPDGLILCGVLMLEARGLRYTEPKLLLVGAASYSLYLMHVFIVGAVESAARHLHLLESPVRYPLVIVDLVLSIGVSVACYTYFERPVGAALRRGLGSARRTGQSNAAALWPWKPRTPRAKR